MIDHDRKKDRKKFVYNNLIKKPLKKSYSAPGMIKKIPPHEDTILIQSKNSKRIIPISRYDFDLIKKILKKSYPLPGMFLSNRKSLKKIEASGNTFFRFQEIKFLS